MQLSLPLDSTKALGPIGFSLLFFQGCRSLLKDSLLALLEDFHHGMLDISRFNVAYT